MPPASPTAALEPEPAPPLTEEHEAVSMASSVRKPKRKPKPSPLKTRSQPELLSPRAQEQDPYYPRYASKKKLSADFSDDTYSGESGGESPKSEKGWRIYSAVGGPFLTGPLARDYKERETPRGHRQDVMDFEEMNLLFPIPPFGGADAMELDPVATISVDRIKRVPQQSAPSTIQRQHHQAQPPLAQEQQTPVYECTSAPPPPYSDQNYMAPPPPTTTDYNSTVYQHHPPPDNSFPPPPPPDRMYPTPVESSAPFTVKAYDPHHPPLVSESTAPSSSPMDRTPPPFAIPSTSPPKRIQLSSFARPSINPPAESSTSPPKKARSPSYAEIVTRHSPGKEVDTQSHDTFDRVTEGIAESMSRVLSRTKGGRTHDEIELSCLIQKIQTQMKIMGRASLDMRDNYRSSLAMVKQLTAEKQLLQSTNEQLNRLVHQMDQERQQFQQHVLQSQQAQSLLVRDSTEHLGQRIMECKYVTDELRNWFANELAHVRQETQGIDHLNRRLDKLTQAVELVLHDFAAVIKSKTGEAETKSEPPLPSLKLLSAQLPLSKTDAAREPVASSSWKTPLLLGAMLWVASIGGVYYGAKYSVLSDLSPPQSSSALGTEEIESMVGRITESIHRNLEASIAQTQESILNKLKDKEAAVEKISEAVTSSMKEDLTNEAQSPQKTDLHQHDIVTTDPFAIPPSSPLDAVNESPISQTKEDARPDPLQQLTSGHIPGSIALEQLLEVEQPEVPNEHNKMPPPTVETQRETTLSALQCGADVCSEASDFVLQSVEGAVVAPVDPLIQPKGIASTTDSSKALVAPEHSSTALVTVENDGSMAFDKKNDYKQVPTSQDKKTANDQVPVREQEMETPRDPAPVVHFPIAVSTPPTVKRNAFVNPFCHEKVHFVEFAASTDRKTRKQVAPVPTSTTFFAKTHNDHVTRGQCLPSQYALTYWTPQLHEMKRKQSRKPTKAQPEASVEVPKPLPLTEAPVVESTTQPSTPEGPKPLPLPVVTKRSSAYVIDDSPLGQLALALSSLSGVESLYLVPEDDDAMLENATVDAMKLLHADHDDQKATAQASESVDSVVEAVVASHAIAEVAVDPVANVVETAPQTPGDEAIAHTSVVDSKPEPVDTFPPVVNKAPEDSVSRQPMEAYPLFTLDHTTPPFVIEAPQVPITNDSVVMEPPVDTKPEATVQDYKMVNTGKVQDAANDMEGIRIENADAHVNLVQEVSATKPAVEMSASSAVVVVEAKAVKSPRESTPSVLQCAPDRSDVVSQFLLEVTAKPLAPTAAQEPVFKHKRTPTRPFSSLKSWFVALATSPNDTNPPPTAAPDNREMELPAWLRPNAETPPVALEDPNTIPSEQPDESLLPPFAWMPSPMDHRNESTALVASETSAVVEESKLYQALCSCRHHFVESMLSLAQETTSELSDAQEDYLNTTIASMSAVETAFSWKQSPFDSIIQDGPGLIQHPPVAACSMKEYVFAAWTPISRSLATDEHVNKPVTTLQLSLNDAARSNDIKPMHSPVSVLQCGVDSCTLSSQFLLNVLAKQKIQVVPRPVSDRAQEFMRVLKDTKAPVVKKRKQPECAAFGTLSSLLLKRCPMHRPMGVKKPVVARTPVAR